MNATDTETLLNGAANEPSRRIVARLAIGEDHTDNAYALLAAVFRQAVKDARRGHLEAINFFDSTWPGWRVLANLYGKSEVSNFP